MKIVKNSCYGGFSLSPLAIKRMAELNGKKCYFFRGGLREPYTEVSLKEAEKDVFATAFSVKNPNDILPETNGTIRDNKKFNAVWNTIALDNRPENRTDPILIKVIEELGAKKASGRLARLEVVEIPDGVEYEIDEYDGVETIREKHRSW